MQLMGIISDTHDEYDKLTKALTVFENYGVDTILHCGDVETPETVEMLGPWNCRLVFGNRDFAREKLAKALDGINAIYAPDTLEFEWSGLKFFATHGDSKTALDKAINSQQYDFVCSGHTHVYSCEKIGRTTVLNPGAIKFGSYVIVDDSGCVMHNPE